MKVIMEAFNMSYLSGREWGLIIGLFPICAVIDPHTHLNNNIYIYSISSAMDLH